ncbi:conjugal transfer protein [Nocardia transvalensis]|uniref:conjugal transfer protein n=1 Tax=Nocardia transvalensis TaxID=37333 RepID=UPI00189365F3|nr:conjugal transfer protein [Nocardia transvalensis]MBF6333535.1 conjugal transfer protein [Nocardia transvalensis]
MGRLFSSRSPHPADSTRRGRRWPGRSATARQDATSEQARWTGGQGWLTKAIQWGIIAALASGVIALALVLTGATAPQPMTAAPKSPPISDSRDQTAAEELARQLVLTWLQASRGDEKTLQPYVPTDGLRLPLAQSFVASDAAIARIEPATSTPAPTATPPATAASRTGPAVTRWSVTVSVTVRGVDDPPATAVRRYFQVPVQVTDHTTARAQQLPAPVSAPPVGADGDLGYRGGQLVGSHPIWPTIAQFLAALTTGEGDVSRYTAPGVGIRPISPPPYKTVELITVATDKDLNTPAGRRNPVDGDTVRALVTAELGTGRPNHSLTAQYALTLTARGGRWEISALDPAPLTAPPPRSARTVGPPSATATPTAPGPTSSSTAPTAPSAPATPPPAR